MWKTLSRRNTRDENSYIELSQCIQEYRRLRETLISLIINTINLFKGVSDILSADVVQCFDVNSLMDLLEELGAKPIITDRVMKYDNVDIENPTIIVIGQTNAGKSTFVNTLLKKNVVCQSFEKCTDRITRVLFSEKNFVELIDENGKRVKKKNLLNQRVPQKYFKLNEDKKNVNEINQIVRVSVNLKLLKCGIDIVDFPLISENNNLSKLEKYFEKSALPIAIYVIDGRAGVKQSDTADLLELKSLIPNLDVIYFITHLDTTDIGEYDAKHDPIDLAKVKMDLSFRKLQYHNFIPTSFKNWFDCPYFHGASLYRLIEHSSNKHSTEIDYNFNQFCKFNSSLTSKMSAYFENKILESCDILMNFQMNISTKIINYAQSFALKTKDNYEQISSIKEMEAEMYSQIKHAISDSKKELISRLLERLEQESSAIIDPIIDTIYPSSIQIPENGIVDDPEIVEQCTRAIMKVLIQGLENILKVFVEEELFKNYRIAVDDKILHSLSEATPQKTSKLPYKRMLERILSRKYKLERLSVNSTHSDQTVILEFMNVVLSSIKTFLSNGLIDKLKENEVNVKNPEWKLQQAGEYLKRCDRNLLAEDVCKSLLDDFERKHREFLKAMESETVIIGKKIFDSEKIRIQISKNTPIFFLSFLQTMNIKGKYLFNDFEEIELIGKGVKSRVYQCKVKGEEMALKKIDLDLYTLQNISEEIFYSQQLSHSNLLTVYGVSIDADEKQISIFYPLKKADLGHYMKYHVIAFPNVLKISLQIADVLKYLHDQGILHKDLKLSNILIDDNEDVAVADYGFCKSEAMANKSQGRIPIHIAPEIRENDSFTKKSDIYAFGILLWHLFEGTGELPKGAIYLKAISQVVWDKYQSNSRISLQKLKRIPENMWFFMENCWSPYPNDRPDIDTIISELHKCQKLSESE